MRNWTSILFLFAALFIYGCSAEPNVDPNRVDPNGDAVLLFQTRFEDNVIITKNLSGNDYISGVDKTLRELNSFDMLTAGSYKKPDYPVNLGKFYIGYESGDSTERKARIVPDPTNPKNKVLMFKMIEPNVRRPDGTVYKARIQANLSGANLYEFSQITRMYLHPDLQYIERYPKTLTFLLFMEWWNESASTNRPYVSRISLRLEKQSASIPSKLYFLLDSEDIVYVNDEATFHTRWEQRAKNFEVPYGKWMTIETYYKEGDANTGRFCMTIQPDGGDKVLLFNVIGATCGVENPIRDGLNSYQPMKFYMEKGLVEFMRDNGKNFEVYWDDFSLWSGKRQLMSTIVH